MIKINRRKLYATLAAMIFAGSISVYSTYNSNTPKVHTALVTSNSKFLNTKSFILDFKKDVKIDNEPLNKTIVSLSYDYIEEPQKHIYFPSPNKETTQAVAIDNTLKPGVTSDVVKELQTNLNKVGFFSGEINGIYGDSTAKAVEKFQKTYKLNVNGIADKETIDKLSYLLARPIYVASRGAESRDESLKALEVQSVEEEIPVVTPSPKPTQTPNLTNNSVSMMEWFGKAEKVFSIGTTATVTDLTTGLSFKVKRTYGYNHADCETLTSADTAIMLKAAGGQWNWNRRPILININGQNIAASLAPMPHAGLDNKPANITVDNRSDGYGTGFNLDSIKGNNMNGHFDIHFLNSKTHETNRVDEQHQINVKKAYEMSK